MLRDQRAGFDERVSLQTLIDCLHDNLWVKDVESRFVITNKVTATRMGKTDPADLIGKNDLELLPAEIAQKFYDDEQKVVRSGRPMIDFEEYVYTGSAAKTWLLTTKGRCATRAATSSASPASRATSPTVVSPICCATARRRSSR